jgi:biopolymer transport protein ExbD
MAMQIPADDGSDDAEPMIEMNTTPLIDVMLVLLVMLIITIPIQLHAVNMNMPTDAPADSTMPEIIELSLPATGDILWQDKTVDLPELENLMRKAAAATEQPVINVKPDRHAKYSTLVSVLSASRRTGLTKIAIDGNEQYDR